ncbi:MAG: T9SS type A sorting domain-containing protein [Ignavibacteriales bacterium]|nr:T9SS type A sorting domain-containing protein [Ignavibacteriales bacterium]
MQTQLMTIFRKTASIVCAIVFLAAATTAHATTHVIQFGGSFGETYSPSSMNVSVGDTIEWEGSFSFHPLSSTSVPAGALSFHQASGTVFSYPVAIAGTYLYQCDFHASLGMTGLFNAATITGVDNNQNSLRPDVFRLNQNFPNPFNPTTMISFDLPFQTSVSIKVYNLIGQEVATILNENMDAGSYSKIWNAASIPSGVYLYRLQAGTFTETKKLVLLK